MSDLETVTIEKKDHVLKMGLNRPEKRNAFNRQMLADLSVAYAMLEEDEDLRVGLLFAHGEHFTGGLDMVDIAPNLVSGESPFPKDGSDPWRLDGPWTKPVVAVAHGWCMTLGIELLLAADIRIIAQDTRFAQIEARRGIFPFGGTTIRFPREAGWGNAMRWILTGDEFDAQEAMRMSLVQEIATDSTHALETAEQIASTIATDMAPLGVQATLASAQLARSEGDEAAAAQLQPEVTRLFGTKDAGEGFQSFVERRKANFTGA